MLTALAGSSIYWHRGNCGFRAIRIPFIATPKRVIEHPFIPLRNEDKVMRSSWLVDQAANRSSSKRSASTAESLSKDGFAASITAVADVEEQLAGSLQ